MTFNIKNHLEKIVHDQRVRRCLKVTVSTMGLLFMTFNLNGNPREKTDTQNITFPTQCEEVLRKYHFHEADLHYYGIECYDQFGNTKIYLKIENEETWIEVPEPNHAPSYYPLYPKPDESQRLT